jgi:hypothetical protein
MGWVPKYFANHYGVVPELTIEPVRGFEPNATCVLIDGYGKMQGPKPAFPTPDALHSIFSHLPAGSPQQRRDPAVAVSPVRTGQGNDRLGQRIFIHSLDRHVALGSTPLLHQSASLSLGQFGLLPGMLHRTATSFRA